MNRRNFIGGTAAISTVSLLKPSMVFGTKANSAVNVGIVGVGNRGTGVIRAMSENAGIRISAAADLLDDKLSAGVIKLGEINKKAGFPEIAPKNRFKGSMAYRDLIDCKDVDAVLVSTPAYAHPFILEAAVAAGKHVYSEKPAGIDADGCRRILRVSENIGNKLSAVIGFQIRYATPYTEMVSRIQNGDIGDLVSVQLYYFSSQIPIKPIAGMSYDEARIRNHFHFNELSGGIFLDQAIHMIDVCNWVMRSLPVQAVGSGGKKGSPDFGNAWTNYQVIYEYPGDVNVSVHSTQVGPAFGDVCARFIGTTGIAEAHYTGGVLIKGSKEWNSGIPQSGAALTPDQIASGVSRSSLDDADKNKGMAFIKSIETGNHINHLRPGCESTLSAILGREAATRREKVTWDEMEMTTEKTDPMLDLTQFDK